MRYILAAAIALMGLSTGLASAKPQKDNLQPPPSHHYMPRPFTCPIGGEAFTAQTTAVVSTMGMRPDFKPYATAQTPNIITCPSNGFPLFQSIFSAAEIAQLAPLVASEEFQQMRKTENAHYLGWWLARSINAPRIDQFDRLTVASWQEDDNPAQKARYQKMAAELGEKITKAEVTAKRYFWVKALVANFYRELGEHQKSNSFLEQIEQDDDRPDAPYSARYLTAIRQLNAEQDRSSEPIILIPQPLAQYRCEKDKDLAAKERIWCQETFPPKPEA